MTAEEDVPMHSTTYTAGGQEDDDEMLQKIIQESILQSKRH